jgi:hypothetical protein
MLLQGVCRTTKSPYPIVVGLWARNAPIIYRQKAVSRVGYYATHYKHVMCFSSANDGDVSGTEAEGNSQAIPSFDKYSIMFMYLFAR